MAQSHSLADFVHRNEGQDPIAAPRKMTKDQLKNLKEDPNDPGSSATANGGKRGAGSQPYLTRSRSKGQLHPERSAFQIYGTDLGSIDQPSTAAGNDRNDQEISGQNWPTAQGLQKSADYQILEGEDHARGGDEVYMEGASQNSEALQRGGRPRSRGGTVTAQQYGQVKKDCFPPQKGDSYPDTTSGQPSILDPAEQQQSYDSAYTQAASGHPGRFGTRLPPGAQNVTMHNRTVQSAPVPQHLPRSQDGPQKLSAQPPGGQLELDEIPDFSYKRQKPAHISPNRQHQPQPQAGDVGATILEQPELLQASQHEMVAPSKHFVQPQRRHEAHGDASRQATSRPLQVRLVKEAKRKRSNKAVPVIEVSNPRSQLQPLPTHYPNPEHENSPYNQYEEHAQSQLHEGFDDHGNSIRNPCFEEAPVDLAMELDYEPKELYRKAYEDLREAPFEDDPNATEFRLENLEKSDNLSQKLDTIFHIVPEYHNEFMRSLSLEEWEDAGDWFLERFGACVQRLKNARREKRKVAEAFEEEVQQQHEIIRKKQEFTQTALDEMKESGGRVLQVTPTRVRKSK